MISSKIYNEKICQNKRTLTYPLSQLSFSVGYAIINFEQIVLYSSGVGFKVWTIISVDTELTTSSLTLLFSIPDLMAIMVSTEKRFGMISFSAQLKTVLLSLLRMENKRY